MYRWDGNEYALIFTQSTVAVYGDYFRVAKVNENEVVSLWDRNDTGVWNLNWYSFSDSGLTSIQTAYTESPGTGVGAITGLDGDAILYITTEDLLRRFRKNGAGPPVEIGSGTPVAALTDDIALCTMPDGDIALVSQTGFISPSLRRYRWNESTLSFDLVGHPVSITSASNPSITALNETQIALTDDTNDEVRTYEWNEDTLVFAEIDTPLDVSGAVKPAIAASPIATGGLTFSLARGVRNTEAKAHEEGDTVQQCAAFSAPPWEILRDLFQDFAGVDPAFIPYAEWQVEGELALPDFTLDALICKPTGVRELADEVCAQALVYAWWDEVNEKIRFQVLRKPDEGQAYSLTDAQHLVEEAFAVEERPEQRLSAVILNARIFNPADKLKDAVNYGIKLIRFDVSAGSANEYGDDRFAVQYARWLTDNSDTELDRIITGLLALKRNTPREYRFSLDAKDRALGIGDLVQVETRTVTDFEGHPLPRLAQIIEANEAEAGHLYRFIALDIEDLLTLPDLEASS
jgi:hypothetical protein